jgi:hypothetical protein
MDREGQNDTVDTKEKSDANNDSTYSKKNPFKSRIT